MAVDMFLKIGDVKGESTDKSHTEEIDVLAWSWSMHNSGTSHMGGGSGAGKASFTDISCTKYVDSSSHALIQAAATGKHFPEATLVVRKAGGKQVEYIKITMEQVLITNLSTGGSGGEDRLTENLSLNFAKFKFEYTPQKADGELDAVKDFTYNIAQNSAE